MLFLKFFLTLASYDRPAWYIYAMNDFIAIDFETAIYAPYSAVSIGLVKFHDFEPVDTY
jgi:hypothetical protein